MMVVVPTVAKSHQRHDEIVATAIRRGISAKTETVTERVGGPDRVIGKDRADHHAAHDELKPARESGGIGGAPGLAEAKEERRVTDVHRIEIALEPDQFDMAGEIGHQMVPDRHAARRKQPAHVTPPEPVPGRMGIFVAVRMAMMMAMMAYPP